MTTITRIDKPRRERRQGTLAERLKATEDDLRIAIDQKGALLDIVNAILLSQQGRIVVTEAYVDAATRASINVTVSADESYIVITHGTYTDAVIPKSRSAAHRGLAKLGLVRG